MELRDADYNDQCEKGIERERTEERKGKEKKKEERGRVREE